RARGRRVGRGSGRAAAFGPFSRKHSFSKHLDISDGLFYLDKTVTTPLDRVSVAERDGIWSRDGVPVEELPDPFAPQVLDLADAQQDQPKRRRWPIVLYSIAGLLFVTLIWLVVTAPLSRALEPLDDPALLLLSDDGHAIARRGAVKEEPVDVT